MAGIPASERAVSILDQYSDQFPSAQAAFDIFADEWSSAVPGYDTGYARLFEDPRIELIEGALGGFEGKRVLELGPLEGGHSYMLSQRGAARVLAIEANSRAFIKCLLVQAALGLPNVEFRHGDFNRYVAEADERFDLILASGVLYHMKNPLATLTNALSRTDSMAVWTHFYDEEHMSAELVREKFGADVEQLQHEQSAVPGHRYLYKSALAWSGFCGGGDEYSFWLERPTLFGIFESNGFDTRVLQEELDHPHGPAMTFIATRRG